MELAINNGQNGIGYVERTLKSLRVTGRENGIVLKENNTAKRLLTRKAYGEQLNAGLVKGQDGFIGNAELKRRHSVYVIQTGGETAGELGKLLTTGEVLVQGVTTTSKGMNVNLIRKADLSPDAIKEDAAKRKLEAMETELAELRAQVKAQAES